MTGRKIDFEIVDDNSLGGFLDDPGSVFKYSRKSEMMDYKVTENHHGIENNLFNFENLIKNHEKKKKWNFSWMELNPGCWFIKNYFPGFELNHEFKNYWKKYKWYNKIK